MPEMSPDDLAWHGHIEAMLSDDVQAAERILAEHGYTPEGAIATVKWVSESVVSYQFKDDAPKEFKDPTNQCCYALHILLLDNVIRDSDPRAIQLGRLWGRAAMGLEFSHIAQLMRELLLTRNRGVGGAKPNDLTLTLQQILREKPDANRKYVIDFLRSDEAFDSFHNTENPTILYRAVQN